MLDKTKHSGHIYSAEFQNRIFYIDFWRGK